MPYQLCYDVCYLLSKSFMSLVVLLEYYDKNHIQNSTITDIVDCLYFAHTVCTLNCWPLMTMTTDGFHFQSSHENNNHQWREKYIHDKEGLLHTKQANFKLASEIWKNPLPGHTTSEQCC